MGQVIVDTDTFYECRSGQHEKCPAWIHSAHPQPYVETRCDCRCHERAVLPVDHAMIARLGAQEAKP